jgi:hypothetical protein
MYMQTKVSLNTIRVWVGFNVDAHIPLLIIYEKKLRVFFSKWGYDPGFCIMMMHTVIYYKDSNSVLYYNSSIAKN